MLKKLPTGITRPILVILGWGTCMAAITTGAIFQGLLTPRLIGGGALLPETIQTAAWETYAYYLGIFAVSVLAAMTISDASKAFMSFFPAYILGAIITYEVLALPASIGVYQPPDPVEEYASTFTFTAFFPIPILLGLAGTVLGIALAERLVS
jgi:hypothetical protein